MTFIEPDTDPTTLPWYGTAFHGNTRFKTTLITHILGNLWMGGCVDGLALPEDFEYVISLYPWEKYTLGEHTVRTEFEMYDSAGGEGTALDDAVNAAVECLEKGKTLIHCQAGLNRSGLVAALALKKWKGMDGIDALNLLRQRRTPAVACNPDFERIILGQ